MRGQEEHRRTGSVFRYAATGFFSAGTVPWLAFLALLRKRGWKFSIIVISFALNGFCAIVFTLAFFISDDETGTRECATAPAAAIPPGFECAQRGPLYFVRVRPDSPTAPVLGQSLFVVQNGCFVAGFDLSDGRSRVETARLYGADCLLKLELDVSSGATSFTSYAEDGTPESSLRDGDGDGVPDIRIEWNADRSFKRSGNLTWVPTSDENARDQRTHEGPSPSP